MDFNTYVEQMAILQEDVRSIKTLEETYGNEPVTFKEAEEALVLALNTAREGQMISLGIVQAQIDSIYELLIDADVTTREKVDHQLKQQHDDLIKQLQEELLDGKES